MPSRETRLNERTNNLLSFVISNHVLLSLLYETEYSVTQLSESGLPWVITPSTICICPAESDKKEQIYNNEATKKWPSGT